MLSQAETIARECFAQVTLRFSLLHVETEKAGLELTFPVQPGLKHEVRLSFQNSDELHLSIGHFWLEWFPCTDRARSEQYIAAVCGFLSGAYRIVEYHRGNNCIRAQLQRPSGAKWEAVGTWSKLHWPSLFRPQLRVVANG